MSDLKQQVERLLAMCEAHAPDRYAEIVNAFPAIARAYLEMVDINQRVLRYGAWLEERNGALRGALEAVLASEGSMDYYAAKLHARAVLAGHDKEAKPRPARTEIDPIMGEPI